MSTKFLQPSGGGLRHPTDANRVHGQVVNPPRYASLGGLDGPGKVAPSVNGSPFEIGNPYTISKPNGGRG